MTSALMATLTRPTATVGLALMLTAAPVVFDMGGGPDHVRLAAAYAKNGGDDGGSGGGGDDRGGGGGGHGSDDRGGDDRGGRGSDDRGSDDNGGHGSDDRGNDDHGRGGHGSDDVGRDDHGRGDDDSHEVTLSDGTRIEIENGRYERKDASGRTIVERPATARDRRALARATGRAASSTRSPLTGGGVVRKVEVEGRNIEVTYTDGWKEEISNGRYELKDSNNRTLIERTATGRDRARLATAVR